MADSPLSDDSLSSIGASTEPLPTSDGPLESPAIESSVELGSPPPQVPHPNSRRRPRVNRAPSKRQPSSANHNESDSTLTEQSSSEGMPDEDAEEDDAAGHPTPKAKKLNRQIISDDEDDIVGIDGDVKTETVGDSGSPELKQSKDANGDDDGSDLTSAAPSDKEDGQDDGKDDDRERLSSPEEEQSTIAAQDETKTSNVRQVATIADSEAGLTENSVTGDADDKDRLRDEIENEALSPPSDDHEEAAAERRRAATAPGKRGAARGRGARGRGARARGRGGKKTAGSRADASGGNEEASDAESIPGAALAPAPAAGSRRGRGARGRGARGKRGATRGAAAAPSLVRSRSSSLGQDTREGSPQSVRSMDDAHSTASAHKHEADTAVQLVTALDDLIDAGGSNADTALAEEDVSNALTGSIEAALTAGNGDGLDATGAVVATKGQASSKRKVPAKKGKKGAKAKDKVAAVDVDEAGDEMGATAASDHEDDQDDAQGRRRVEAMEELTKIEIAFARLRDRLYVERMTEVEKERIGVETGSHPELIHLNRLIELRRKTKLDAAKKLLNGLISGYERRFVEAEHTTWQWWANERDDARFSLYEESMSKRRKLDREKRKMDRPKEDGLTALLAPRPLPEVPLQHHRRLGFHGEPTSGPDILWSVRHSDVRVDADVTMLDELSTRTDLERMGLRAPKVSTTPFYTELYTPVNAYAGQPYIPLAPHYSYPSGAPPPPPAFNHPSLVQTPQQYGIGELATHHASQPRPATPGRDVTTSQRAAPATTGHAFGTHERVSERHAIPWQSAPPASPFDGSSRRKRTASAAGSALAEPFDVSARTRERSSDGARVVGDDGLRARLSLDDHMAHARSPKQARTAERTPAQPHGPMGSSGRNWDAEPKQYYGFWDPYD